MKNRYWTFLIYPDSAPENWKEIIEKWFIPVAISPIHDKDKKEDGEGYKKAHYHALICFNGPTTYKNVMSYAEQIGAKKAERIASIKGAYEYWIHKNNPEKAQYKEEDRININFNEEEMIEESKEWKEEIKRSIIHIIKEQKIKEYKDIYDYLDENGLQECLEVLAHNTIFFTAYLSSYRNKEREAR